MDGVTFELSENTNPTICFATMCKNEEHCIKETLESVYKYIDTWVVLDTGSTDNTCQIVTDFFKEKGISGELFIEEWKGFGHNKTQLFNKCYGKSDYILHIDADDLIVGDFKFNVKANYDAYYLTTKRGGENGLGIYKSPCLFNNKLHWKVCGIAHTIMKCLEKQTYLTSDELLCNDVYLHSRTTGSRSFDPLKFVKDAEVLQKQFFDTLYDDPDLLNERSIFYTAQSYWDANKLELALKWYSLHLKLQNNWFEQIFESHLRIAQILIILKKSYKEIKIHIDSAISISPDRAEPYSILGKHCNHIDRHEEAYHLLKKAYECDLEIVKKKYLLFVMNYSYDKYILDELSVSCYWTKRLHEGKKYLLEIIDDPEFKSHKERFDQNLKHFNTQLQLEE